MSAAPDDERPPALPPRRPSPPAEAAVELTETQLRSLFDILTHYETYQEIRDFRDPTTIYAYGTPFAERATADDADDATNANGDNGDNGSDAVTYATRSRTPVLHLLFNRTVLSLPPAQTLAPAFWHVRVQQLVAQLAAAGLSESYDQGALGTRKILATASSALLESLGRGALGGHPGRPASAEPLPLASRTYDTTDAVEFARAWNDVLHAMVYDGLVGELFAHCAEHASVEDHSPAVKAAADYVIINLAEFLHYVFVLSPNGRYLTKLADSIQQLMPYSLVRQTLRVSNAASMVNGMMRVLLAKLSIGGLTNWIGLTSAADDGMNVLQRIVSLVLAYDTSSFKKTADKIERSRDKGDRLMKACLAAIRGHVAQPPAVHEAVRQASIDRGRSVVAAILEASDNNPGELVAFVAGDDAAHALCAQYYAALLSVRDRRAIADVFCRQTPDLFTHALREGVGACDPLLRRIHDKIDLKAHLNDAEAFITALIEVSKGATAAAAAADASSKKDKEPVLPTVKDYVELLRSHRGLLYKWLHRLARDTPDISDMFRAWAVETIKLFRGPGGAGGCGGAGAVSDDVAGLFAALPANTQKDILPRIDEHAAYLDALDTAAIEQRQRLLDKISGREQEGKDGETCSASTAPGAGRFLARWQGLLDETQIGPATAFGPLRRGHDVAHVAASGKAGSGGGGRSGLGDRRNLPSPDVSPVVAALGEPFRALLRDRAS